ncbi:Regulator of microtubule dynamics protein 1 [Fragariocoptes setiger]|uniref:Regulator of microtubule dynamics protein 1 n=1 Tax=Fragariocoptes setiger TaxID=1670756 RepID=A0ABQ7S7Z8_9ACAR|nr:Regulator of microtubule dynamics protein 1 [Fragariocoptes setiger]
MPPDYGSFPPQLPGGGVGGDTGGFDRPSTGPYQQPNVSPLYGQRPAYGMPPAPVYNQPSTPIYNQTQQPGQAPYAAQPGALYGQPQLPVGAGWQHPPAPGLLAGQQAAPGPQFKSISEMVSSEDMRTIRQCNRDSFFYRCIPLGVASCSALYYYNIKKSAPQSIPKFILAGMVSWIVGKLSYRSQCEDRLISSGSMSPFVQYLRRNRGLDYLNTAPSTATGSSEFAWDDSSTTSGFVPDDPMIQDQTNVSPSTLHPSSSQPGAQMTYEQLRAQNRGIAGMPQYGSDQYRKILTIGRTRQDLLNKTNGRCHSTISCQRITRARQLYLTQAFSIKHLAKRLIESLKSPASFVLLATFGFMEKTEEEIKGVSWKTLRDADKLFDEAKYEQLLELLKSQTGWYNNEEVLWRVARCEFQLSKQCEDQKAKHEELLNNAYLHVQHSLELNDKNGLAHKWAAILLNAVSSLKGTKERVLQVLNVRKHMEKAIEYAPMDPTSHYLLGEWHYSCYQVSWWERKLASVAFGTLPDADLEVGLKMFEKAEEIEKDFYSKNKLMLAKTLIELKRDNERVKCLLNEVVEKYSSSDKWDDKEAVEEAKKLLKTLK